MKSQFLPELSLNTLQQLAAQKQYTQAFDYLMKPLHEEMYRLQDFTFLETLSPAQELCLRLDYAAQQILSGGYIQLIQNKFAGLLLPLPELLQQIQQQAIAQNIDNALKVYSLNFEQLNKETSLEEFTALYQEFEELNILDKEFETLYPSCIQSLVNYALDYPEEFMKTI